MNLIKSTVILLIAPKQTEEDAKRRERILNILLLGSLLLSLSALLIGLVGYFARTISGQDVHRGMSFSFLIGFNGLFITIYIFSRIGFVSLAAKLLVLFFMLGAVYTSYAWGADVPQSLLIYSLTIIMTGILLSTRAAFIMLLIISAYLFVITYIQINQVINIQTYWKRFDLGYIDSTIHVVTLSIITLISWLSNREIEKSLHRARTSEAALKKERDMLEVRVVQRTKELQKAQLDKMIHLYRFADFGRLASGLLHDLVSPLTTVALNLDHLQSKSKKLQVKNLGDLQEDIIKAIRGTERIESYVQAAQKQIKQQESNKTFSINEEIKQTLSLYTYRARKEGVKISLYFKKNIKTYGNPIKFNQLMSNLISNAFDSYDGTEKNSARSINISILRIKNNIVIKIQDHGKGIKKSDVAHIFDPFFTTKQADKGTGIGLSISKDIVTKNFNGTIRVKSEKEKGTEFIITFPIKHEPSH